jgi:hypothetical protein
MAKGSGMEFGTKCVSDGSMRPWKQFAKKMLATRRRLWYQQATFLIMKTFAKSACLVLLTAWGGVGSSLAQTNVPPSTNFPQLYGDSKANPAPNAAHPGAITNPPSATAKPVAKRFSGKILSLDSKTKTMTLEDPSNVGIAINDQTKIIKARKTAAFADLAAGQQVVGMERQDAAGHWYAVSLNVGDPRQILDEPIPKTFIPPPPKTNAVKTNAPH